MEPLWRLSACQAVEMLKTKKVTPLQLVEAAEARWKETDPVVNAMPITCWEQAKEKAQQLMQQGFPEQLPRGYLYGLPIAIKDVTAVKGLPFTKGSLLHKDDIADHDDPLVQRLEEKGAIIVGKTNTPEFGCGSQTYNKVFGTTFNPWDTSKTSGGSSGGSAVALAVGQVWLATGSDFGGSLRNPASYCGIVGMRNTIGLVPQGQSDAQLLQGRDPTYPGLRLRSVSGVMARCVADLALGLDAVVGQHPEDTLSLPVPEQPFSEVIAPGALQPPKRVAFSADLGVSPVCQEVVQMCRAAAGWWQQQGAELIEVQPEVADAPAVFETIRAYLFKGDIITAARFLNNPKARELVKPEIVWQLQCAVNVQREQVDEAMAAQARMIAAAQQFLQQYDLLLCPTVCMQPFDASIHWPKELNGFKFTSYIDWLRTCSAITVLGLPAISVPCGCSKAGLPVGLQIIGPPGGDAKVLAAAAAFEGAHQYHSLVPMDVVQNVAGS